MSDELIESDETTETENNGDIGDAEVIKKAKRAKHFARNYNPEMIPDDDESSISPTGETDDFRDSGDASDIDKDEDEGATKGEGEDVATDEGEDVATGEEEDAADDETDDEDATEAKSEADEEDEGTVEGRNEDVVEGEDVTKDEDVAATESKDEAEDEDVAATEDEDIAEAEDEEEIPISSNLIPIDTIESVQKPSAGPFIPRVLLDDPDTGDGSASREGVEVSSWRLHRLKSDRMGSMSDPKGTDRRSRKIRKVHYASRRARTKKRRTVRRWLRFFIGFLVVACSVAVTYVGVSYVMEMWGGKTIPYVVGLSEGNAIAELMAKGFVVSSETIPADVVSGHVIQTDPAGGLRVDEGIEVHLTVSTSRTIPEVVGMGRDEARSALEAAGAGNIRFEARATREEEEDKVLEVRPAAGAVFMSTDEVTLVVSQLPRMINVVGEEVAIALQHLEQAGIAAQTQYEQADADQRMHVVRTAPAADEPIGDDGGVEVFVGDPLSDVAHLCDYFDAPASHTQDFLRSEGFERRVGHFTSEGETVAGYSNGKEVVIGFLPEPWSHSESLEQGTNTDVMTETAQIDGVRMQITVSKDAKKMAYGISNPTVGVATAQAIMRICGFQEMLDSCTQTDITLPAGTNNTGHVFYCCCGEQGTTVWTVLIKGTSEGGKVVAKEIVATCAPKVTYAAIDLSTYGGSICSYVAYQDEYK